MQQRATTRLVTVWQQALVTVGCHLPLVTVSRRSAWGATRLVTVSRGRPATAAARLVTVQHRRRRVAAASPQHRRRPLARPLRDPSFLVELRVGASPPSSLFL